MDQDVVEQVRPAFEDFGTLGADELLCVADLAVLAPRLLVDEIVLVCVAVSIVRSPVLQLQITAVLIRHRVRRSPVILTG